MFRKATKALASKAEGALMEQLPFSPKTRRIVTWLLEPKHIKRIAVLAVGGSIAASAIGAAGKMRMYRCAMAKELKKQLEPLNKKLDQLEEQNEELKKQNRQLRDRLEHQAR